MSEETAPPTEPPRYDILIVCQNRHFNVVEQGLKSLINYLQASGLVRVYDEAVAETWTEVYCKAGPTAHELFVKGAYNGPEPLYYEMAIRSGMKPTPLPYGPTDTEESSLFWIDIRGALYQDITGALKNKLKDVLYQRLELFVRPHEALPPHPVVGEDEKPIDKKRRRPPQAKGVGTAVEEL